MDLSDILFNNLPFASYAIDAQTFEIIYMNNAMKELIDGRDFEFCWQTIYNQEEICPWCQIQTLKQKKEKKEEAVSSVEFFEESIDMWIKNYDQLITLSNGKVIKYTIIVDISDQKEIQGSMIRSHAQLAIKSKQLKELNAKLNKTLIELNHANQKLTFLAQKDYLTGIDNRRRFFELGNELFEEHPNNEKNLYIIMMDIDKFKLINDTYGHSTGDDVLKLFVKIILKNLESGDIFGRLGGEEFAIITLNNDDDKVISKIDMLRKIIQNTILNTDSLIINFTVSSGISKKHIDDENLDSILERADKALYNAKNNGRNRVEIIF